MPIDPYQVLARFYDGSMGYRPRHLRWIKQYLRAAHPQARTLLELACGTGSVLQPLSSRYRVSGLDRSTAMLRLAKKKLPHVPLFRQDMTFFRIPATFDAVICVFNSLNHVLTFDGWRRVFRQAARHLNPLGVFIFEVNTIARLSRESDEPSLMKKFGPHYLAMTNLPARPGTSTLVVNVFEHRGKRRFHLVQARVREAAFPPRQIRKALTPWCSRSEVIDPVRPRPTKDSERLFFVCHKRWSPQAR